MVDVVNTEQSQAWNGYEGRHWADNADRYDEVSSGFNRLVLDAAGIVPGERVLDIGCGTGQLTRLAAGAAGPGHARGVDLSGPMLATARARALAQGVPNVSFEQGDVQVHPFRDGEFDVALSRFAVMFFADPVAAFANVRRALGRAGRLAFVCMTEVPGTDLGAVLAAMAPFLPRHQNVGGVGPASLADPRRVRAVLTEAGFGGVTCDRVEAPTLWGRDVADAAEFIAGWGPVKFHLDQAGPADVANAVAALASALAGFARPDGVWLRGAAWLVTANA